MSLITAVGPKLERLPDVLLRYESELEGFEANLTMKGKTLQGANVEQATWLAYYDQRRTELYTLMKYMERECDRVRGKLWKDYTENHSRDLGSRDKDQYINNEPGYLTKHEMYLEVQELHNKYEAVVEAFKARGYALNNIVKLRTSSVENDII